MIEFLPQPAFASSSTMLCPFNRFLISSARAQSDLEDSGCYSLANMAMDVLMNCNPKVASHYEKANMEQGIC
ncbi:MAG: hypothetical protein LUO89_09480 [Methanothrix sp.]|nr:hypothetical protein [Methanothrix sp.]